MDLHLILNNASLSYRHVHVGNGIWETSRWKISNKRAALLVGGNIYLHKNKTHGSFAGGTITAIIPDRDRFKIQYKPMSSCKHMFAEKWGQEKAYS